MRNGTCCADELKKGSFITPLAAKFAAIAAFCWRPSLSEGDRKVRVVTGRNIVVLYVCTMWNLTWYHQEKAYELHHFPAVMFQ